jgi:hypothetical protein
MWKEKYGDLMTTMHFVGPFMLWMIITLLMEKNFISCVVCFVTPVLSFKVHEQRKEKNHIVLLKKWNNNIAKTCGCKSCFDCKKIQKEMSNPMKSLLERQPAKKNLMCLSLKYHIFWCKRCFLKRCCATKIFFSRLVGLLVVKNHLPIQFVESTWLKHFVMHLCPKVVFPFKNLFSQ